VVDFNTIFYDEEMQTRRDLDKLTSQWNAAQNKNLLQVSIWTALSNGGKVWDMVLYNGALYIVGEDFINSMTSRGVSKYTIASGTWAAMSTGFGFATTAVCEMGGDIYAANDNGFANPSAIFYISKWNGSAWVHVAEFIPDGDINRIISDGSNLYVATGGGITKEQSLYDVPLSRHVAKYNGSVWSSVGGVSDASTACNDLVFYGGVLHGGFNHTGDGGLQAFIGGFWTHIALTSLNGRNVQALAVLGGSLVIASGDKIGVWDGVSADLTWIGTLSGGSSVAYTIATFLEDIYIGGNFTTIDAVAGYNYVAKYSGGAWSKLGNAPNTGVNNIVHSLLWTGDDLYVGGEFTTAGGVATTGFAVYNTDYVTAEEYIATQNQIFVGAAIHEAPASAVTDSDEFGFWEDVSNALRKITWANIKAALKTYFDTLYAVTAKGVTNGDSHDHIGGDGAAITAAQVAAIPNDGWIAVTDTWTYASASTITIPSDGTLKYQPRMKIRLKQGAGYKYYTARTVTSTLLTVFINTDYTVANAAITDISYSFVENPFGFPFSFNIAAPTWSAGTVNFTNQPGSNAFKISFIGGTTKVAGSAQCNAVSGGTGDFLATFAAGVLPAATVNGLGLSYNFSTGKVGSSSIVNTETRVYMSRYDFTTLAGNSELFGFDIIYI
jgi:hypothetical protein